MQAAMLEEAVGVATLTSDLHALEDLAISDRQIAISEREVAISELQQARHQVEKSELRANNVIRKCEGLRATAEQVPSPSPSLSPSPSP